MSPNSPTERATASFDALATDCVVKINGRTVPIDVGYVARSRLRTVYVVIVLFSNWIKDVYRANAIYLFSQYNATPLGR